MTKIDIISGFLGAGKTTLIKKMLEESFQKEKIVLIENEYGEVGIDGGFLKNSGIEISELNSGCICCSLVGDFNKNMKEVLDKFHPDRVLVEPSGVGKLSDVMKSVIELQETEDVKLNALITVVNAKKAVKQMKSFGEFFENQVENASTIVLSRTQDLKESQVEECVKALKEANNKAAIITTPWDELKGETILAAVEKDRSLMEEIMDEVAGHHDHDHDHDEDGHCSCGHDHHDHDHDHDHDEDGHCSCGHDHHDHDHDHHHDEDGHCSCGHDHHDHDHDHHHDEDGHCSCGHDHHDHDHEGHHHADDVFISWGVETPHKFEKDDIVHALNTLCNGEEYENTILRAKGMVPCVDGTWIYFDMVPGDYELRAGDPDYTGRLVVIGTNVNDSKMKKLFGME